MKLNSWQVDELFTDHPEEKLLEYVTMSDVYINRSGVPVAIYTPIHITTSADIDIEMQYMYLTTDGNWKTQEDLLPTDVRELLTDPETKLLTWDFDYTATEKTILMLMGKL